MKVASLIKVLLLATPVVLAGCHASQKDNIQKDAVSVTDGAYAKPEFKAVDIDPSVSSTKPVFKAYSSESDNEQSEVKFVAEADAPKYLVRAKSTLEDVINEWAGFEGYTPYFLTDRKINFKNIKDLELPVTSMAEAMELIFTQLSLSAQGFHYQIYEGSKTLRVYSKK